MEEIKLNEAKISTEPQQTIPEEKLSVGVRILSILFIACGVIWVFRFFPEKSRSVKKGIFIDIGMALFYIVLGAEMLISGIGMLKRKYWALQLTQALAILAGAVLCLVYANAIAAQLENNQKDLRFLLLVLIFFVFFVLLLWFLFKKSTVNQFKSPSERKTASEATRLEKKTRE